MERLCLLVDPCQVPLPPRPVSVILAREGDNQADWKLELFALKLVKQLSSITGLSFYLAGEGPPSKQFARANKQKAIAAIVIGSSEMKGSFVTFKWLDDRRESPVPIQDLQTTLTQLTFSDSRAKEH